MKNAIVGLILAIAVIGSESVLAQFTDIVAGLPGVAGSAVWGDYDNDGDLDILLTGREDSGNRISRVYRNDSGTFVDIGAGLVGVSSSSVAWGDFDNDGDLDILLTGSGLDYSRVYRNNSGTFVDIVAGLAGVSSSSVAWGDYDNDGDLDILLTGQIGTVAKTSRIYRNSSGTFVNIGAGLEGVIDGSVAWGDYDNDGDLDILLAGKFGFEVHISRVYRNDSGTFVNIEAELEGVGYSSVAWGDYDNDGDLDILLTGLGISENPISRVYRNDSGTFVDIGAGLTGVGRSSVAWGDYDNDGDLDILLTGRDNSNNNISSVYRNDSGTFVDIGAGLVGVSYSSVAWGDYDNDGDLDILLTGRDNSNNSISRVYQNLSAIPNTPPSIPTNLSATDDDWSVTFSWDAASDAETPSLGLTYNLRIGRTPGGSEISSAMADAAAGYRRVVQIGNAQQRTSWKVDLPSDVYYWSVQAVDGAFAGGPFAAEQIQDTTTGVGDSPLPKAFALRHNVPNPFNPTTTIRYDLPTEQSVSLRVYDIAGRLVKILVGGVVCQPGRHQVAWDGRDDNSRQVASGTYFYRLEAGSYSETKRMILIK